MQNSQLLSHHVSRGFILYLNPTRRFALTLCLLVPVSFSLSFSRFLSFFLFLAHSASVPHHTLLHVSVSLSPPPPPSPLHTHVCIRLHSFLSALSPLSNKQPLRTPEGGAAPNLGASSLQVFDGEVCHRLLTCPTFIHLPPLPRSVIKSETASVLWRWNSAYLPCISLYIMRHHFFCLNLVMHGVLHSLDVAYLSTLHVPVHRLRLGLELGLVFRVTVYCVVFIYCIVLSQSDSVCVFFLHSIDVVYPLSTLYISSLLFQLCVLLPQSKSSVLSVVSTLCRLSVLCLVSMFCILSILTGFICRTCRMTVTQSARTRSASSNARGPSSSCKSAKGLKKRNARSTACTNSTHKLAQR